MDQRKVVFIMGPGHCGSTLLDLILGSHSESTSLAEFTHLARHLDSPDRGVGKICAVCDGPCAFWDDPYRKRVLWLFYTRRNIVRRMLSRGVRYLKNPYSYLFDWTGSSVIIDSSKAPHWFKRQLRPRAAWRNVAPYLLYLGRDGRAVVNSYLRKYPERGIETASENWRNATRSMTRYFDTFPFEHKMRVCYEDLAASPEITTRTLCEFLGIGFEPSMLRYWAHPHHPVSGNAGTHSLILRQREQLGASTSFRHQINVQERYYKTDHYADLGLAIKPDFRWTVELSAENLQVFDRVAGEANVAFAREPGARLNAHD